MKFRYIFQIIIILFCLSQAGFADIGDPDPDGIEDTVALVYTIDWDLNKIEAEVYCFTDYDITLALIGFTWGSSTSDLVMDSAKPAPLMDSMYYKILYENGNIDIANNNRRFLLFTQFLDNDFIPGDASQRRLWATYYFTMDGSPSDVVSFDTLTYLPTGFFDSTFFQFANKLGHLYTPKWAGANLEGDATCCILRGDVVKPPDGMVLVNHIVYLVDYLWKGGTAPECLDEGDCAIPLDGSILVNDIVFLVEYLWKGGTAPPDC